MNEDKIQVGDLVISNAFDFCYDTHIFEDPLGLVVGTSRLKGYTDNWKVYFFRLGTVRDQSPIFLTKL